MKQTCVACPFNYTDESEIAQNYGCLPAPFDIRKMYNEENKVWMCHENSKVCCKGLIQDLKEKNIPLVMKGKTFMTVNEF
jgi:uncharacterized pyridoxamine 5'-phosphate oxidase family protein